MIDLKEKKITGQTFKEIINSILIKIKAEWVLKYVLKIDLKCIHV